mmetsp:Transcript_78080/g.208756  ORF Transcript_78080/g.208756 Transcript_78080/m.208756 type:complete len:318 (+) Transcript_78080:710-1663(+)
MLVHIGASNRPICRRLSHSCLHILHCGHLPLHQITDPNSAILLNAHIGLLVLVAIQQVPDSLIVDLCNTDTDEGVTSASPGSLDREQLFQAPCVQAGVVRRPFHCIRLAGPSLSVRENADIVPVEHRGRQRLHLLEDLRLTFPMQERLVKIEPLASGVDLIVDAQLRVVLRVRGNGSLTLRFVLLLMLLHRSASSEHADVAFEFQNQIMQLLPILKHLYVPHVELLVLFYQPKQFFLQRGKIGNNVSHLEPAIILDLGLRRAQCACIATQTAQLCLKRALQVGHLGSPLLRSCGLLPSGIRLTLGGLLLRLQRSDLF